MIGSTSAAGTASPMSIELLIAAVHELDASLREILDLLARVKRHKSLLLRWRTTDEQFRVTLSTLKLAASSMTVFLSEYKNVILESLVSGKVSYETLRAEIASLTRNVDRRRSELVSSQKQSTMQDLCKDLISLLSDTQAGLNRQAVTVEKQASGLLSSLTQLDGQLQKWTSKQSKLDWSSLDNMDFGPFVCAPVAIMLNTKPLPQASRSVGASEAAISTAGESGEHTAAQTPEVQLAEANPDLGLKTDLILDTYTLFLLELRGLTTMLEEPSSVSRDENFNQRLAVVSHLHGDLIQLLDLYSKQALFSDRGNTPSKTPLIRRGTAGLRKPFACFLCGSRMFHLRVY